MTSRIICIARVKGSGGEQTGRLVADALGFQLVDEEILQRAAESEGVSVEDLSEVEQRSSVIGRLLKLMAFSSGVPDTTGMYMPLAELPMHDPKSLRSLIQKSIHETADRGNVVIVSHAASFALAGRDDTLRVLVTAPTAVREARIATAESLDAKQAAKAVVDDDAGRANYLKKFYDVEHEQPAHYDLVLNGGTLSADAIAALVIAAANA
jgi:cytidylate kinase